MTRISLPGFATSNSGDWQKAAADQKRRISIEAAIKLGHIETEGISSPAENRDALPGELDDDELARLLRPDIEAALQRGRDTPGYAAMRYRAA